MEPTSSNPEGARRGPRPEEQAAVATTIVGGRPPGSGQPVGQIPRGIEILVKKASVDPAFRAILLERRAAAAAEIGLALEPAEALMLAAVPAGQLEAIIARIVVPEEHRRAFLGKAAATMLATLGLVTVTACKPRGVSPDRPPPQEEAPEKPAPPPPAPPDPAPVTRGISPDRPPPAPTGIRPDRPPADAER
jgi:hypothetical protein